MWIAHFCDSLLYSKSSRASLSIMELPAWLLFDSRAASRCGCFWTGCCDTWRCSNTAPRSSSACNRLRAFARSASRLAAEHNLEAASTFGSGRRGSWRSASNLEAAKLGLQSV